LTKDAQGFAKTMEDRQEFREDFLEILSHELRTPLTSIMGFIETVLEGRPGPLTKMQQRFLQNSYRSSERLLRLVEDLLTVAQIQKGEFTLNKHRLSPSQVVQYVQEMAPTMVEAKSVQVEIQNEWPSGELLLGDQSRLEQAITYLIDNAIKFSGEGEKVVVHSQKKDIFWRFEVVDTGMGIPEGDLPHVFTPFYRSRNAIADQIKGSGLGLCVCKAIIEGHGGQIYLESILDKGTRVWFDIPVVR
jgi:signal transduction histidine kinase